MKTEGPNSYRLELGEGRIIAINGQEDGRFKQSDGKEGIRKIYVVKSGAEVIYIGSTKQNFRTRLQQGLKPKEKHNYPYKWGALREVEIMIWCFPDQNEETENLVEAVEAELVYLIRKFKCRWPRYQMEIHFHSNISTDEKKTARKIFDRIYGR